MFAKYYSLSTSCGVNHSMTALKESGKISTMFVRYRSLCTSCRVNLSTPDLKESRKIFTLTLKGDDEEDSHFLTPDILKSLISKLKDVKSNATNGSVLITTAEGKNFCQGFDVRCARAAHSDVYYKDGVDSFRELVNELISLPMPTIAAINGYTKNAGLILAMSHDYLTMKTGMGALCMDELKLKMTLPDYFTATIRSKVVPGALTRLALSSLTLTSKDAKEMGLVVEPPFNKNEEPLDTAIQLAKALSKNEWDGKVYAKTRKALYPDLCNVLGLSCAPLLPSRL